MLFPTMVLCVLSELMAFVDETILFYLIKSIFRISIGVYGRGLNILSVLNY